MEQLIQFNIMKSMKRVQSAYLISILLFSSSLVLLILHSIKSYSISSLVSFMKSSIDRNHMFLICNGILVILVKSSSSVSSSTTTQENSSDYSSNTVQNDQCLSSSRSTTVVVEKKEGLFSAVTSQQKDTTEVKIARFANVEMNVTRSEQLLDSECCHFHDVNDNDDHDDGNGDHDNDDQDDEEGAEELNKRCEEFIRRMKHGIMSESRKDLGLARFS